MSKLNCEIIKDLIPLYVDNVCSSETKSVVDEHIEECKACNEFYRAIKNAPTLPSVETDVDKAVVKVGKKMKKHTKKAVIKAVSIIMSILLVIGFVAFMTIPLALAKNSYNDTRGFLYMQSNCTELPITNKQKPNFNGKYGSVYIDESFGKYTVNNHEGNQQLIFDNGKKITFLRYEGEEIPAQYFNDYIRQEYNPFVTTHLPFLIPIIEKGTEQLGFTFDDINEGNLRVYKTLAETHCDSVDGYFKECAYYYLYEIIMPFTNGAFVVSENDTCEGYGYTMYNDSGTTYMIEMQLKDNIDTKCTVVFIGFNEEDVTKIFDSFVIVP